jgi:hypothetical protein
MADLLSGITLSELANNTVDAIREVANELPAAQSLREVMAVVTKRDRQIYLGVALLLLSLLLLALF